MFFRRKKKAEEARAPRQEESSPREVGLEPGSEAPEGSPSTQFLTGETGHDRKMVQVLLEAIAQVSESRDLQSLLNDIVDRSIAITGAERGLLLLEEAGSDELSVRVARQRGGKELTGDLRFSTSIAGRVLSEVQPLRATVHSESEALELGRSVYDLKLRAAMCVPLVTPEGSSTDSGGSKPVGVLYVDSRAATRQFNQEDLSLFAALAQHISIAMENARLHFDSLEKLRLEQSLELASAIQRDLMPRVPKDTAGWDVHGWYGPAEKTAGDFYDFVKVKDGRMGIVVGDVTGHGIGPALITATAQASLRSYLRLIADPGEVVTLLNQDLCERVEDGRFLTLFLALLASNGEVHALNGGHALPFIWRKQSASIETIGKGGPALGMIPDETYEAHDPLQLEAGDVLVIYTDGLTEARDPQDHDNLFAEEGVKAVLAEQAAKGADAQAITLALVEAAMETSRGEREDDITVVVACRT